MRKLIIVILIMLILLFAGIFVVDERENAVVTSYGNGQTIKSTGIHFAWPIIQKVDHVYINQRSSLLNFAIESSNTNTLQIKILVSYQVINPVAYLQVVKQLGQGGVNKEMTKLLLEDISHKIQKNTLAEFNQQGNLLVKPINFAALGIRVDQINLVKFIVVPDNNPAKQKLQSASIAIKSLNLESAYYAAQIIKSRTELEVGTTNQKMQLKDPAFYDYFSKLKMYEQKAKYKADMPPLSELYSK